MASKGDYRRKESKKPKKGAKRPSVSMAAPLIVGVEVVKSKGKKVKD